MSKLFVTSRKSFYWLWSSQTMSNAADILYVTALTVLVLQGTESVVSTILVPFFRIFSQIISGFLAPLMLRKFHLPRLMLLSQGGQLLFFVGLALYVQGIGESASLAVIFALVFVMSFLDGWTTPVRNALVPRLVEKDWLMRANGLISVSDQTVQFAGWGISGVLVAFVGAPRTMLLAGILYAVAFVCTALIREPSRGTKNELAESAQSERPKSTETRREALLEGWRVIGRSRRLRGLTLIDSIDMLGGSVWVGAFTLLFVQEALGKGEEWWGFINAAYFAGAVLGGLLVVALVKRLQRRLFDSMLAGIAGYAVLTIAYAHMTVPAAALLLVLVMGPFAELSMVARRTLIQQSAEEEELPKVLSAQATVLNIIFCASLLGMAKLAEVVGIVNLYLYAGGMSLLAFAIGIAIRRHFVFGKGKEATIR
ncbi:MFS transporter [Saccharibacillus kuerlensis]|uniref:MFS-type transporter YfmI n=1 Tax=Saccharibacillus kuerlensis TaxID=459527 RepID=A0ABQ2L101_9BACL|nr:MFS transporter [Saccharibacillus kuerlensis]GGN98915.1 putative MFS-type transporter YfmI [Saccharibacillus kuerlensis]